MLMYLYLKIPSNLTPKAFRKFDKYSNDGQTSQIGGHFVVSFLLTAMQLFSINSQQTKE